MGQTGLQSKITVEGYDFLSYIARDLLVEYAEGVKASPPAYLIDGVAQALIDSVEIELKKSSRNSLRSFVRLQFEHLVKDKVFCQKGRNRYQLRDYVVKSQQPKDQLSLPLEAQLFSDIDSEAEDSFAEGAAVSFVSITYERDPKARRICLGIYGFACIICNFNFEAEFGPVGRSYIHVHHLEPLHQGERQTNPENDLRPVCPNCHAMLHKRVPPFSIEELKEIKQKVKK